MDQKTITIIAMFILGNVTGAVLYRYGMDRFQEWRMHRWSRRFDNTLGPPDPQERDDTGWYKPKKKEKMEE